MSVDLSDLINSVMRKLAEFQRTFLTHTGTYMSILGNSKRQIKYTERSKVYVAFVTHPPHVLQAQGDGVVAVLLPAVLIYRGRIEDPFVVQILHQTA